jgi:hypothetical protein
VELGDVTGTARPAGDEVPQESRESADTDAIATPPPAAAAAPADVPLPDSADAQEGSRRSRRTLLVTGAGATLAVVLTGAFLGGLFLYDGPSRDRAASDDVRAPVPDGSTEDGTSSEAQSARTASASPTRSATSAPSTPRSDSPAPPTASSATPTTPPSSAGATRGPAPGPSGAEGLPPVLRLGDEGPEVTELQLRLRQIGLYGGDTDGDFDHEVESAVRAYQLTRVILGDESGVYGTATRTSLESETSQP